ncbi:hypothetical protein GCM10010171_61440 [Actinokineospora fastidiosa]|uniref:LamG-like jellyroll fold domain-containing protein n=1 Tax=Actinokineospora fastidiosa TaxID=1816 RepID=A0A918LIV0_9PSEU|nr:hypothetical protein GCM10010171_61440 [Actinokineospora fastidiosa]
MKTRRKAGRLGVPVGTPLPAKLALTALALALIADLVIALTPSPERVVGEPVAQAQDAATALLAARNQGSRVEVLAARTETRTVFAEPDGTLSAEIGLVPTRVRKGADWVTPDTALVRGDGLRPAATTADVRFAAGADEPLVRLGGDSAHVELTWPGRLPEPRVDGAEATYPDVLPGVDLVMTATLDGYTQHLVVKDREAAKSPALRAVRFGMKTYGVTLRDEGIAGLQAYDRDGDLVFAAPTAVMWDSAKRAAESRLQHGAVVAVDLTADTLTLRPDQSMLDDPDTVFPVIIDPDMRTVNKTGWTTVYDDGTTSMREGTHWNGANSEPEEKGYVPSPSARVGRAYGRNLVTRSFFQFDTSFVGSSQVLGVQLKAAVAYGPSCSYNTQQHRLYVASSGIGAGTNWNNQPSGTAAGTSAVPSVWDSCQGYRHVGFSAPSVNPNGSSTYFLRAVDESDQNAWRKYVPAEFKLEVRYNGIPGYPTNRHTVPDVKTCARCAGKYYTGDSSLQLKATLSDPDGDQVEPEWDIYYNGVKTTDWDNPLQGSGTVATKTIDLTARHGESVSWYVRARDSAGATSGFIGGVQRDFYVDRYAPYQKPTVYSALYPADNAWHGGPGVAATFGFGPGASKPDEWDDDIAGYYYGWSDPPTQWVDAVELGRGAQTPPLTPPGDGPQDLYVQSADRAGNRSPMAVHHFYVRPGNGPLAHWPLESDAEDTAYLGARDGVVVGDPDYTAAAVGSGIHLDGTGNQHATAPTALPTSLGHTVSAWVRLDESSGVPRIAVSQSGQNLPGFALGYRPKVPGDAAQGGFWAFGGGISDVAQGESDWVLSTLPAQAGAWTHITGVRDTVNNQARIYVNGSLAGTRSWTHPTWSAGGEVSIGRVWRDGQWADPWRGGIDEVKLYDRELTEAEIKAAVSRDNVRVAHWKFDEVEGTTAANEAAGGEALVLQPGASFGSGGAVDRAMFTTLPGAATTAGPMLRTDGAYTVTAWAKFTGELADDRSYGVVSQAGQTGSAFLLGIRGRQWKFVTTKADGDVSGWASSPASAVGAVDLNDWTHLAAVHDPAAGVATLYVDGHKVGETPITAAWNATGALNIGRSQWGGAWVDRWTGGIDEVRLYSRVLGADEIQGIVSGDAVDLAQWRLDGDAADADPQRGLNGIPSTTGLDWTGGQSSAPSHTDLAVRLDGTSGHIAAPHVVDTSRSFSVAAWVKPDTASGGGAVLSQDGELTPSFGLFAGGDGRWNFSTYEHTLPRGGVRDTVRGSAVQAGVWSHVVAVYDADVQLMQLYVNGVQVGSSVRTTTASAGTGGFQIGRSKSERGYLAYFAGAIDDVSVHSRALFADEIRVMSGRDTALVHHLAFEEPSGTRAGDSAGARAATLTGGVAHVPGRLGNGLSFDGATGVAATTGVDLRTDDSFTVSGWVYLPDTVQCDFGEHDVCIRSAISLDGPAKSKFRLGHVASREFPYGRWTFELPEASGETEVTKASVSTETADFGSWVHLVGVYNVQTGKTWIYVNGDRQGDGTLETKWHSEGGLVAGRGKSAGAVGEYWPGKVDDVRVYAGAFDKPRVESLYGGFPPSVDENLPAELPTPKNHWLFDELDGTTVADVRPGAQTATMHGGAERIGGRAGKAGWFDGTTGYAQTAAPALDTARDFSVAAWTYLTTTTGGNRTVVAQDGNRASAFMLQFNGATKKWAVLVPRLDQDNPPVAVLTSEKQAHISEWSHLVVTYTAASRQLRLYVDGHLAGAMTDVTPFASSGPMTFGRSKWNGQNTDFYARGVDDVRTFSRSLGAGEVSRLHADAPAASMSYWKLDSTTDDSYWRQNYLTLSPTGTSYVPGVHDAALALDGVTGSAVARYTAASLKSSFSVAAWVRLDNVDRTQTILSQDGLRTSGFVLQYRHEARRWAFGIPDSDSDDHELRYAGSAGPAVAGEWTHLAGVYDGSARQLRLYVNGALSGVTDNVVSWWLNGPAVIGRGKVNGQPAHLMDGTVDEVLSWMGVTTPEHVANLATWPAPPQGQLGRFVDDEGNRYTASTGDSVRPGFHFETPMGVPAQDGPNTVMLHGCRDAVGDFTSTDPACAGQQVVGQVGRVYSVKPTNIPTLPLHRCVAADQRRFDAHACDGATSDGLLGHVPAYAALARYGHRVPHWEHHETIHGAPPGHAAVGVVSFVSLVEQAGTTRLFSCRDGEDVFSSVDPACEGKRVLGGIGWVWTAPLSAPDATTLRRCGAPGTLFVSVEQDCEARPLDRVLGHAARSVPVVTAQFPSA